MSTLWYYSGRYLLTNVLFFLQFIIILCHLLPLPIYFAAHATEQNLNRHFSFLPNAKRKKPNDLLNVTKWRGSHNHIYTYKTWILYVCLCVRDFRSHQKSQAHEILALGLLWAILDHYEARFSKFWFLRGLPIWSSVKNWPFFGSWNCCTLHNAFDSRYSSFIVPQYFVYLGPQMAKIRVETRKGVNF